jgi:hypothetical protein
MKTKPVNISQSLIKDIAIVNSSDPKEIIKPAHCPKWIKFKYVLGMETKTTDAQLYGQYFEWHLLGATRGGKEPVIPKVNIKDLRPTKSASKNSMIEYIIEKSPEAKIVGTGKQMDLKPKPSSSKNVLIEYIFSKGGSVPEKATKEDLIKIIDDLPEDLGDPEITQEDYFNFIQTLPPDMSPGEMSKQEITLKDLVEYAKKILEVMGLDVNEGEKQVFIKAGDESGHLDWVTHCYEDPELVAIYDVKFTKTKLDDWRNGWGDPDTKEDAKIQATHYTQIYHKKHGVYPPFYFFIVGETGWIKFLRYRIFPVGFQNHKNLVKYTRDVVRNLEKHDWPARPLFNRCLFCDFAENCESRSLLPEIEEIKIDI